MDFIVLLNTVLLGLVGLVLGVILIPFSAYSFPIKGLGKICFSLGAMCHHSGTCLMYDTSGYSLCHMRKKADKKSWETYYQGKWISLSGSVINMLGNRPFGISYIKERTAFLNELEIRTFADPVIPYIEETEIEEIKIEETEIEEIKIEETEIEWYYTRDDIGTMTGVINKDAVDILNKVDRGYVISLRLLVNRLSESGGIKLGERAITTELKKAAMDALTNNSTNTTLLLVSLASVLGGATFGYLIWFSNRAGEIALAAPLP